MSRFRGIYLPLFLAVISLLGILAFAFPEKIGGLALKRNELFERSGVIEWVRLAGRGSRDLQFKFVNQEAYINSGFGGAKARDLIEEMKVGSRVTVLADLHSKSKPIFDELSYLTCYEIIVEGKKILAYEEEIESNERARVAAIICLLFLLVLCVFEHKKYRKQVQNAI
jgi:hypothetical protein